MSLGFEHIDVLSDHPLNSTGKAMYTGKAMITFIDHEIVESFLYDTTGIKGKSRIDVEEDAQKKELQISELLLDFEVLKEEQLQKTDNYFVHRFDGILSRKYNADFGYCTLKYKSLIIEWDELIDRAWFEER
ncbi:hypothetical protein [Cohnella sp. AR92]|uniref:Uncharacterized protein n=1 Tax=Cohnella thailandensis TaxID=557557 RepID=A0A841SR44_9BACL|nr:hypothetical protein [Cohnella sp. AR92]MBB6632618.1 hypothetical protein [Cohnella thailandensis]RUS48254.1 hypothetical protein ELR57_06945 [Cohnella sp. AR92]